MSFRVRLLLKQAIGSLVILAMFSVVCMAQNMNGAFDKAIEFANPRLVKVYGATAGRVDGYSSGVVVSPDGLIVTMQGVYLDGYNTRVVMHDGKEFRATVLRRHRSLQLALLKIEQPTPEFFELSESPVGSKGDWVVTLSNAFKVANGVEPMSINLGIVSLRTRIDAKLSPRDVAYSGDLVLIDAITSNPGAGGGAVVSVDGKLVGSIGRVINSSETNTRLNYAVPSDVLAKFVAGTLKEPSRSEVAAQKEPSDLGIRLFTLGGRGQPAYIDRVIRKSPAHLAELKPDDLVISMNGVKVNTVRQYHALMKEIGPGEEVIVIVKRGRQLIRIPMTTVKKK